METFDASRPEPTFDAGAGDHPPTYGDVDYGNADYSDANAATFDAADRVTTFDAGGD